MLCYYRSEKNKERSKIIIVNGSFYMELKKLIYNGQLNTSEYNF